MFNIGTNYTRVSYLGILIDLTRCDLVFVTSFIDLTVVVGTTNIIFSGYDRSQ
jgi:hypothetical protein